jgi:feruloyl esterase
MSLLLPACLALAALIPLSLPAAAQSPNTFKQKCLSFTPEKLVRDSTRTHLEYVTNGTNLEFPDNVASCSRPSQVVSANLCRIALSIPTSNNSGITLELWLPEDWPTARYISTGNGGIDGCRYLCY